MRQQLEAAFNLGDSTGPPFESVGVSHASRNVTHWSDGYVWDLSVDNVALMFGALAHPDSVAWSKAERAFGSLAGFVYAAEEDVRADLDAADEALRQRIGGILKLGVSSAPTPQNLAARIGWKVSSYAIRKGITGWSEGSPEQTRVGLLDRADRQASFLNDYHKLQALVEVGYPGTESIPATLLVDHGDLKAPETIAHSAEPLRDLGAWSDSTDHGHSADVDNLLDSKDFEGGHRDATDLIGRGRILE